MTSTLTAATLSVTLTESINLNGYDQGSKNITTIASIAEVSKRIVTVTTTEAVVATFSAAIAAGNYIAANIRYIRLTNLDDTNFIT